MRVYIRDGHSQFLPCSNIDTHGVFETKFSSGGLEQNSKMLPRPSRTIACLVARNWVCVALVLSCLFVSILFVTFTSACILRLAKTKYCYKFQVFCPLCGCTPLKFLTMLCFATISIPIDILFRAAHNMVFDCTWLFQPHIVDFLLRLNHTTTCTHCNEELIFLFVAVPWLLVCPSVFYFPDMRTHIRLTTTPIVAIAATSIAIAISHDISLCGCKPLSLC